MKVRTGFVSNSSSSSFILGWGVTADGQFEELKNFLSKNKIEYDGIIDYAQKSYEDVKLFMRHLDNGERILYGGNDT